MRDRLKMIFNGSLPLPFKPTVEIPASSNGSYFITECPIKKYRERKFHQGPQIMGFTSDEALSFARRKFLKKIYR